MCLTVERAAGGALANAAHRAAFFELVMNARTSNLADGYPFAVLLEQEWHSRGRALVAQRSDPLRMHGAGCGAAFAPNDHP